MTNFLDQLANLIEDWRERGMTLDDVISDVEITLYALKDEEAAQDGE